MSSKDPKPQSVDAIVEKLKERIVNHDLPPGSKLLETSLAGEFNISRQKLRDAFSILESRGLIERVRNQGAIVTRLTTEQVKSLYMVRGVLEGLAVNQATRNAPKGTWTELQSRFGEDMEMALDANELDVYVNGVTEFRHLMIKHAHNPILTEMLDALYDRTRFLVRRLVLVPGRAKEGMRQQQAILAAMSAGDAELAEKLKRENIQSALQWFIDYQSFLL